MSSDDEVASQEKYDNLVRAAEVLRRDPFFKSTLNLIKQLEKEDAPPLPPLVTGLGLSTENNAVVGAGEITMGGMPVFGSTVPKVTPYTKEHFEAIAALTGPVNYAYIASDAVINIEGVAESIDLERLRRIIYSASKNTLKVRQWLDAQPSPNIAEENVLMYNQRASVMNYLSRTVDSLAALSDLLKASEVSGPFNAALDEINKEKAND